MPLNRRCLAPTLLIVAIFPIASQGEPAVATKDKTGKFRRVGTIRAPRDKPASNGDVQRIRWSRRDGYERIVLDLHENDFGVADTPPLEKPGSYRITNENFPCRVVCNLSARQANGLTDLPDFSKGRLISGLSRMMILDDDALGFAIDLKAPVEIEVFELRAPARIVIDLRPADVGGIRFSVRTPAMRMGDALGHLEEKLMAKGFPNTRQLRCPDDKACIELASYLTKGEADAAAKRISDTGIEVLVEERGINDLPTAP